MFDVLFNLNGAHKKVRRDNNTCAVYEIGETQRGQRKSTIKMEGNKKKEAETSSHDLWPRC